MTANNSWRPLNVSLEMIDLIMAEYDITPSLLHVLANFKTRTHNGEEGFCPPFQAKVGNGINGHHGSYESYAALVMHC